MSSFNKVILLGNLCRDPEMRYTPKGTGICSCALAVNRTWKSESGEQKEEVSFIDFVAFGRTAETIGQYFRKGKKILIEGRLKQETWEDKNTHQKRSKIVVQVEGFSFADSGQGESEREQGRPAAPSRTNQPADDPGTKAPAQASNDWPAPDDDVPF